MYLLLVAYDFPPIPSPQALRWIYLVRALSDAGHRVEVIAPNVPGYGPGGLPEIPASVVVHRVFPGRMTQFLLGRGGARKPAVGSTCDAPPLVHVEGRNWKGRLTKSIRPLFDSRSGLNWKGRLAEKLKAVVSNLVFPDYRIEWVKYALSRLDVLLETGRPDVVVVSHEPACTLPVGLAAARRGLPLVVDMGDPVLAPYTPDRWRKKAFELEGSVCRAAMLISVTTEAAAQVLQQRHQLSEEKLIVIRQGFNPDFRLDEAASETPFDPAFVELLYTGSFYSFRRAEVLLDAVLAVPGVRLSIASIRMPDYLVNYAEKSGGRIRLLGFLSHTAALVAQRSCDILVNLANEDPVQVPGKVFEYMGAGKPIMHLRGKQQDATGALMTALHAGWDVSSETEVISALLADVCDLKRRGELSTFAPDRDQVKEFSWPHLAETWFSRVESNLQASLHQQ
ncbi:glycosyltransferase [Stenotrophomonas sp. Iso1]|uniref:glycosyltransferase n=1 Tax=Stenotrophomonas sp. Iso1 TaxID=2977283 RepID=UPI0022B7A767|nr:glycosyltransferase [Stenotrophomonas sp. Iso1]